MLLNYDKMIYQIIEAHLIISSRAAFEVSVYLVLQKESVPRGGLYGMPNTRSCGIISSGLSPHGGELLIEKDAEKLSVILFLQ